MQLKQITLAQYNPPTFNQKAPPADLGGEVYVWALIALGVSVGILLMMAGLGKRGR